MKIEELKTALERIEAEYVSVRGNDTKRSRAMLEAIECVIIPTRDNDARIITLLRLIMSCSEIGKNKHILIGFTASLISADYMFSIMRADKAVPFLNRALELYCKWMESDEVIEIQDEDAFINQFRAYNLKGKVERKKQAINCIYIYNEAAYRLNLKLHLTELLDDVPELWDLKQFVQTLILSLVTCSLICIPLVESMAPWRAANQAGNPISIFQAWIPMDLPLLYAGILMLLITIGYTLWIGSKNHIYWMSKWAYWKFNR